MQDVPRTPTPSSSPAAGRKRGLSIAASRSTEVHNLSVIYGWEFVKDAHLYLVYNGIRDEDDPETIHSLFAKLAYTFR